jgi:peroxiredoxin Q/BCP
VRVVAVSVDDVEQGSALAAKEHLAFPLLSDPGGRVAARYGVLGGARAHRVSFVLDERGVVRHVDAQITLSRHGPEIAQRIRDLRR